MATPPDTPFAADLRALLAKHAITAPRFAHGSRAFDAAKPSCLYSGPVYGVNELVAGCTALVEGKWSVAGEYVHRFEQVFSRYLGQAESVMVNSGSSADLLLIAAAKQRYGWKDGDGIIVSPVGFPTSISAITLNGLTPIFVDIEWATLNADNDAIEWALGKHVGEHWRDEGLPLSESHMEATAWPRVRAILVSPVLGNPPDMDRLTELAARYGVKLLMDGCDSLGSTWRGQHLASYATASTCSFFPSHHISTLQGGMISSNDTELIRVARQMSAWGRACYCTGAANLLPKGVCGCRFKAWLPQLPEVEVDHKYVYETQGFNLQPLDLQGALGLEQMERIDDLHAARREAFERLDAIFAPLHSRKMIKSDSHVQQIEQLSHADPSWFGYPIICPTYRYKRALVAHLEAAGIQTRNYFAGNILLHPGYEHLGTAADYPNAQQVLQRVLFIGTNPSWADEHFAHIEATIKAFVPPAAS